MLMNNAHKRIRTASVVALVAAVGVLYAASGAGLSRLARYFACFVFSAVPLTLYLRRRLSHNPPVSPMSLAAASRASLGEQTLSEEEVFALLTEEYEARLIEDKPSDRLRFFQLIQVLKHAQDPLEALKQSVDEIRSRIDGGEQVSDTERFLADQLQEVGLFDKGLRLPHCTLIELKHSSDLQLAISSPSMSYAGKMCVIAIEGVLNRMRRALAHLARSNTEVSYAALSSFSQGSFGSLCAQLEAPLPQLEELYNLDDPGEWTTRQTIALLLESLTCPVRLQAKFRVNAAEGLVALHFDAWPPETMPASRWSAEKDAQIMLGSGERERLASSYAARMALLLAGGIFRYTHSINHVCISGVRDSGRRHSCYLSLDFEREKMASVDFSAIDDPFAVLESFEGRLVVKDGILRPVKPLFSLEDPRFCPPERYELPELSERSLSERATEVLGSQFVSELSIQEDARRSHDVDAALRLFVGHDNPQVSEHNVRVLLDTLADNADPLLRERTQQTVEAIIDGSLDAANALAIREQLLAPSPLEQLITRCSQLFGQPGLVDAVGALQAELARVERDMPYADDGDMVWRYFNSYAQRALYNRLIKAPHDSVLLVPDSYYVAHLLLASILPEMGQAEQALAHARRSVRLCPLDMRARLALVRCLERQERYEEAAVELGQLLEFAYDQDSCGMGYYRMAFMQWQMGNYDVAAACYQHSLQYRFGAYGIAMMEFAALKTAVPSFSFNVSDEDDVVELLERAGIPLAPSKPIIDAMVECSQVALDEEIFPLARNFAVLLGRLTGDDVVHDIIRSIEDEPDR